MKHLCLLVAVMMLSVPSAWAQVSRGHRLPEGPYRPVREREIDIESLKADLTFDMAKERISGTVTIAFTPLRSNLKEFSLDAANLEIRTIELASRRQKLPYEVRERRLRIVMPEALNPGQRESVEIAYSCRPRAGMYFFPGAAKGRPAQAWNYGEGGLHYAWLPLYNDVNDRFTAELAVTVERPFVALSNGKLEGTRENSGGTRTFRWVQEKPIPNYLLTIDVGEFARVPLEEAKLASSTVPLAVWTPAGTEAAAKYAFGNTPKMVEFFSSRFKYPYPWAKYDQVMLRDFIGAMETATMVGFSESYLHHADDPPDSNPQFGEAYPTWTYEDTIAHELAHHWFGDLVTCRSLGSIWLNESFATFCQTLWTGQAHGEDDLTYQRWRYLNKYLDYVRSTGTVRPMEYFRYSTPNAMYQTETTYLKGSLVLHMMRHIVGDEDFFRGLADYLRANEFQNVESANLLEALQESCGRNLSWFFEDWIVGGGGHPVFEVSYRWAPERRQVDLTVRQIQADLPFENDFRLPVDVEIVTATGARLHRVEINGWETQATLPADGKPLLVVFDKGGWLVSELKFDRPMGEVIYQLDNGGLAERLRAARELADDYPRHAEAVAALARVLADSKLHWGLRQEAALDLGRMGGEAAASALVLAVKNPDRRVRRAVAVALGSAGGRSAEEALRIAIESDPAEDVVASAELSLGRLHAPGAREFLRKQLGRESRWWNAIRVGALQGLTELADSSLISLFESYTDPRYEPEVRGAALEGWFRAAPGDAKLAARLRVLATDRTLSVRSSAVEKLGALHRAEDMKFLSDLAASEPDPTLAEGARQAAEEIRRFVSRP